MSMRQSIGSRTRAVWIAVVLLLSFASPPAMAQEISPAAAQEAPALDMKATVVTKPQDDAAAEPAPDTGDLPVESETGGEVAEPSQQEESINEGVGSAQLQTEEGKRQEFTQACQQRELAPPTNSMLGLPGSIGGDDGANWGPLLLIVALTSGAVALFVWWRRSRRDVREPRDPLETASTIIGVISAVVGLALTFFPSLGADAPPPPSAQMETRMAHARITHGEYVKKLRVKEELSKEDRSEVGNVVWLRLHLEGYSGKPLRVQYGTYTKQFGGALLPGTTRQIDLGSDRGDVETTFVPIWVGHPRRTADLPTFSAQFRLIDPKGQILEMARTGPMATAQLRYAC